ncbi:hypothetical protein [Pleionea sp. CnH1-48]|uniref:hypothetical protein n=1 Tax=Pleionea sp. CnH1-48 TaxID=2954494 RepID=UPI00209706DC|nr:hypothetical protein [Pleionea sp. CnH1-48]MCO7227518.1 hypothetical protein [Pleionea sp. CnH1-48]
MPTRRTQTPNKTHQAMKNTSYESIVVTWLMQDGWQVFLPVLDHGHQTDILISDGPNYFRIQVKTFSNKVASDTVCNQWAGSNVDVIVYFARSSNWGVLCPAFDEESRPLNYEGHRQFTQDKKSFLREFHLL